MLCCLPSVFTGFALDDYVLLGELSGRAAPEWAGHAPFDLFRWFEPSNARHLMNGHGLAWWTGAPAQCAFFRPLASLTHTLDYMLAPNSAVLAHLHNLLWFGLLLWAACRAYAELLPRPEVARLASLLFALDYAHGSAVGWISNRNALIGGAFGITALLFHHRAREAAARDKRARLYPWIAWASFACALLSAELSIGMVGYLFAYAVFYDRAPLGRRARSLGPYAIVVGLWTVGRAALNYQSFGVGVYTDPLQNPVGFLRTLPQRWLVLIGSQWGRLSSDLQAQVTPEQASTLVAVAGATFCGVLWFVWPSLRASRTQRFLAAGAALSAIPLTATLPNDRLLVLVGFGALAPLAASIWAAFEPLARAPWAARDAAPSRLRHAAATLTSLGHTIGCLLVLPVTALSVPYLGMLTKQAEQEVPSELAIEDKAVIVASVPDSMLLAHARNMRVWQGEPTPDRLYWLQETAGASKYERVDEHTLRVHTPSGMFRASFKALGVKPVLRPGTQVRLSELTINIIESNAEGKPSVCDFVFDKPLESARYRWLSWKDGKLRPFQPPRLGDPHDLLARSGARGADHSRAPARR